MKRIAFLIFVIALAAVIIGGAVMLLVNLSSGNDNASIATNPEEPQIQAPHDSPTQLPAQTVVLPPGTIVEHEDGGLMLLAPDGSAIAALFEEEETGVVGYLIMSGSTGRVTSGAYRLVQFPEQLNVLVTTYPDHIQLTVNLPTELTQDFVQTFIEYSMEANGLREAVYV